MNSAREEAWRQVFDAAESVVDIGSLFANDAKRTESLLFTGGDLLVDLSRQRIDAKALGALIHLASVCHIEGARDRMFAGVAINTTEGRAVLHTALRAPIDSSIEVDGVNVVPEIHATLNRMGESVVRLVDGTHCGATGKHIKHVVNIGIGGSDLGPAMANLALSENRVTGITSHYVSNVDPADIALSLRNLDPESTVFVVSSKTFTTEETMANAHTARAWLESAMPATPKSDVVSRHLFAVTANVGQALSIGISPSNIFPMWEWVGGRFSLGSAIGFSLMCTIGEENFREMLAGMHEIDEHFRTAPLAKNIPVLLALVGIWNRNALGCTTQGVIPYLQQLGRFPAFLQQLEMESNGKRSTTDGDLVELPTSPVVWGEPGTNGQHAFFQLLHQGVDIIPVDFIGAARSNATGVNPEAVRSQHEKLLANMFAQASALAFGAPGPSDNALALGEHRVFPGNRPSTTILFQQLTPRTLGQLVSLYEHKTFVQGCIWGVNSFDQWGVELGKVLAGDVLAFMSNTSLHSQLDATTKHLITWCNAHSATP